MSHSGDQVRDGLHYGFKNRNRFDEWRNRYLHQSGYGPIRCGRHRNSHRGDRSRGNNGFHDGYGRHQLISCPGDAADGGLQEPRGRGYRCSR